MKRLSWLFITLGFIFLSRPLFPAEFSVYLGGTPGLKINGRSWTENKNFSSESFGLFEIDSDRLKITAKNAENKPGTIAIGVFKYGRLLKSDTVADDGNRDVGKTIPQASILVTSEDKPIRNFRVADWHTPPDDVKKAEIFCPFIEVVDYSEECRGLKELKYETLFRDFEAKVTYGFFDNKLAYGSFEIVYDSEKNPHVFNSIIAYYKKEYSRKGGSYKTPKGIELTVLNDETHGYISIGRKIINKWGSEAILIMYTPLPMDWFYKEMTDRSTQK